METKKQIYVDYQATTPTDPAVVEAMLPYFTEEFGNPHSSDHAVGWRAAKAVDKAASHVAKMIGADPDEIIFTSGATESNNLALFGPVRKSANRRRKKIFIGATEHKCVLAAASAISEQTDFSVFHIPVDAEGVIDLEWLEKRVDEETLLVSVMAVNNEIGTFAPLEAIAELCTNVGAILHSDAAQAPYALDISNLASLVDLISLSGHKMYGPKGIGCLYVRRSCLSRVEPIIYGGGQQSGLRSGTIPTPLAVGLGVAARIHDQLCEQGERLKISYIRDALWDSFQKSMSSVSLNGPSLGQRHPGNLNVMFKGWSAHDILMRLQPKIAAATGAACASGIEEPSHVLREIGLSEERANSSLRFSLGRYSKLDEAEELVRQIKAL